jgi:hypothetical protein
VSPSRSLSGAWGRHPTHGRCRDPVELVTLDAIAFYERRGLRRVAIHAGAVDEARRIKPSIPLIGEHGLEIHDELEFELALDV